MKKEDAIEIIKKFRIDYDTYGYDVDDIIRELALGDEIKTSDGSSKTCMIFIKDNFVIKWANGISYQNEESNEALQEVKIYEKAKVAHLEMFFPYTELLGKINNTYFVLQKKIDYSVSSLESYHYNKIKKYKDITKTASDKKVGRIRNDTYIPNSRYNRTLNSLWVKMALVIYGKKVCKRLCSFIRENQINDLHNGNIGYKNDKPIILDFSGFNRK